MQNVSIYKCKDGRTRVYLRDEKRVISYPRYVMEEHLGRPLESKEQIHHKDGNPLNNDISNLEIRLLGEHQKEHNPQKYFDKTVKCGWCNKEFLWTAKQQRTFHGNNRHLPSPFCSKSCVGQYGKYIQVFHVGVAK